MSKINDQLDLKTASGDEIEQIGSNFSPLPVFDSQVSQRRIVKEAPMPPGRERPFFKPEFRRGLSEPLIMTHDVMNPCVRSTSGYLSEQFHRRSYLPRM